EQRRVYHGGRPGDRSGPAGVRLDAGPARAVLGLDQPVQRGGQLGGVHRGLRPPSRGGPVGREGAGLARAGEVGEGEPLKRVLDPRVSASGDRFGVLPGPEPGTRVVVVHLILVHERFLPLVFLAGAAGAAASSGAFRRAGAFLAAARRWARLPWLV